MKEDEQPRFGIVCLIMTWVIGALLYYTALEVLEVHWYKLTSVILFSFFVTLWLNDFDRWPLDDLGELKTGAISTVISLFLAVIMWEYIGMTDWDPMVKGLPMAFNLFFLYFVVSWSLDNGHLKGQSKGKRAMVNMILYFFTAYILIKAGVAADIPLKNGLPFFWLPMALFYFYSMDSWVTDRLEQPSKGIVNVVTVLFFSTAYVIGLLDIGGADRTVSSMNPELLAWTAVLSAAAVALYIFLNNYPWNRLRLPLSAAVGLAVLFLVSIGAMQVLHGMLSMTYERILTLGFCVLAVEGFAAFNFRYGMRE